jgi:hypothetical protein
MRKIATVSMIAAAAFAVAACSKTETANNEANAVDANATMVENGTTNDTMTAGNEANAMEANATNATNATNAM